MQDIAGFKAALKNQYGRKKQMPISQYFKGHGEDVMRKMRAKYGPRAERVFYATANKHPMFKPDSGLKKSMKSAMRGRRRRDTTA